MRAHTAVHKPQALAAVEGAFALLPAEVDLATAVTMSPRTFAEPLSALARAAEGVARADVALTWMRVACVLAALSLVYCSAESTAATLRWVGGTLLVAGGGLWLVSWSTAMLGARSIPAYVARRALADLPADTAALAIEALSHLLRAAHGRIALLALIAALAGGLLALAGMALRLGVRRPWRGARAWRTLAIVLALGLLTLDVSLLLGERAAKAAREAYRTGDLTAALAGYRAIDTAYPLAVRPFVHRARRDLSACERYRSARAARTAGEYGAAVDLYEALLVGVPPVAVRAAVEGEWAEALYAWADALSAAGKHERALDRYRAVRDGAQARATATDAQRQIAALYLAWGDALREEGDYRAAVATYARVRDEVAQPRLWLAAEERQADALCAWQEVLRAAGDAVQAEQVCQMLGALPTASARCSACE